MPTRCCSVMPIKGSTLHGFYFAAVGGIKKVLEPATPVAEMQISEYMAQYLHTYFRCPLNAEVYCSSCVLMDS